MEAIQFVYFIDKGSKIKWIRLLVSVLVVFLLFILKKSWNSMFLLEDRPYPGPHMHEDAKGQYTNNLFLCHEEVQD